MAYTFDSAGNRSSIFVSSYKTLKKWVNSLKIKGLEVHHLIEKRFADILGVKESNILSVALDKDTHAKITKAFREVIGYKNSAQSARTDTVGIQEIWDAVISVYEQVDMAHFIPII